MCSSMWCQLKMIQYPRAKRLADIRFHLPAFSLCGQFHLSELTMEPDVGYACTLSFRHLSVLNVPHFTGKERDPETGGLKRQ